MIIESVGGQICCKHNILSRESIGHADGLVIEYDGFGKPERFTGGADTRGAGLAKEF